MEIKTVLASEIKKYILDLAKLRITVFREYPYLYEGDLSYEKEYLKVYENSPNAVVVLAVDGDRLVGASTGLPLIYADEAFQKPFQEKGFNLKEIYYFGESVLLSEYRGKGFGKRLFLEREKYAYSLPEIKITTFCAVEREKDYRKLDGFWASLGYTKHLDLFTFFPWKDIGENEETLKKMVFWLKQKA